jgi:IS1 family transposase
MQNLIFQYISKIMDTMGESDKETFQMLYGRFNSIITHITLEEMTDAQKQAFSNALDDEDETSKNQKIQQIMASVPNLDQKISAKFEEEYQAILEVLK